MVWCSTINRITTGLTSNNALLSPFNFTIKVTHFINWSIFVCLMSTVSNKFYLPINVSFHHGSYKFLGGIIVHCIECKYIGLLSKTLSSKCLCLGTIAGRKAITFVIASSTGTISHKNCTYLNVLLHALSEICAQNV